MTELYSALVIFVSRARDHVDLVPRLHVLRSRAVSIGDFRHAIGTKRAFAVALAEIAMLAGDLTLLDNLLPLRVVLVLDEIDDGVDHLGVNVPLRQNEFLLDDGMVVLNRTNIAKLVLFDDQVVGLDQTLRRDHALRLDGARVIDVAGLLDHFLTVVVARRRALVAVTWATVTIPWVHRTPTVVPGEGRGGDNC